MKKKYIVPGLLVIRLSSKQTLLQASFEKGEGEFDSSEMSFSKEYNNTFPNRNIWDEEW